jgi:hypothetical protein
MSDNSLPAFKPTIHKEKVAEQQFKDQLSDLWHLQEKKNRLNREELFKKAEEDSDSQNNT